MTECVTRRQVEMHTHLKSKDQRARIRKKGSERKVQKVRIREQVSESKDQRASIREQEPENMYQTISIREQGSESKNHRARIRE